MKPRLHLRRAPRCPWSDFRHRIRIGLAVFVLIVLLQRLFGCG
ncbi:hypothetical protein [Phaeovulum sp. NW3]|nr:hypothetical protein [Phaeovulum sp. NW3]